MGDISVGDRIALSSEAGKIRDHRRGRDQLVRSARSPNRGSALRHWITPAWPAAAGGARFVAGEVTLVERPMSEHERYELGPTRTRLIFSQKGWSRVIGFHTRNVPHRVHEFIQLRALDMVHADGLYISPVIGPKKSGDFLSGPILQSYQVLLESGVYPPGKVVLGVLHLLALLRATRSGLHCAICRKNMGCDYFVVGTRSHGVWDWYKDHQTRALFESLDDLGVTPIFFEPYGFNLETNQYDVLSEPETVVISGTQ